MPAIKPDSLVIHMYRVGFGDCFLLEFRYPQPLDDGRSKRFVLIDFGTIKQPENSPSELMSRIAEAISSTCGGQLDVVVATHRHKDHLSGFRTRADETGPGDIIRKCKPRLVLQPWTEDPELDPKATARVSGLAPQAAFVRSLLEMNRLSELLSAELRTRDGDRSLSAFPGEDDVDNINAVKNLVRMGENGSLRYLQYGDPTGIETLLPGVKVRVLGPPSFRDWEAIGREGTGDKAEYWHALAAAGFPTALEHGPEPASSISADWPRYARWFIPRIRELRDEQLMQFVTFLNDALNNTSLILLFEVGSKKLLFPGDAQLENWSYAFSQADKNPTLRAALDSVDVYKVGHHGSHNATPQVSLWNRFEKRDSEDNPVRLITLLSTQVTKKFKEVPHRTLYGELDGKSKLYDIRRFPEADLEVPVPIDL